MTGVLKRRNAAVVATAAGLAAGLVARFTLSHGLSDGILLVTLVGFGAPLVFRTAGDILQGHFAADIVAALAILAAALLHQYFAGVVIVLMQSGGEALERYALARASSSLDALLARAPQIAHRLEPDGRTEDVAVDRIRVGDTLILRPGDLVPVDATVLEGRSSVDQSALTGEPFPVSVHPGSSLMSGSLNGQGALTIRALHLSTESQYQQIVRLVEQARAERPPIQRLADRWAAWFTPLTLLVCAAAFAFTHDLQVVLAVLVVATPCPLILAVPVAVIAAVSRAADVGVIVKNGVAIEQLGRAEVVVFDKTGTLTLGQPTVAQVTPLDGIDAMELLRLVGGVEQYSSHHMGQAVAREALRRLGSLPRARDFHEVPGSGVSGMVDDHHVVVGSVGLLNSSGV